MEAVNGKLVKEFETGSEPASVARRVGEILVPAIHILQARTNNNPSGKDSAILEEVNITNTIRFMDLSTYLDATMQICILNIC